MLIFDHKLTELDKYKLSIQIFEIERSLNALSPNLLMIYKDTAHAYAQNTFNRTGAHSRIYMPFCILKCPVELVIGCTLHEVAHHVVGIKESHNAIFKAKEQELCENHGLKIDLASYSKKDEHGNQTAYWTRVTNTATGKSFHWN